MRVAGVRAEDGGMDEDEGEGEKAVGRGSRWREECKGGLCRRPVESDEERAARAARENGGGRKREESERLRRARCARRERGRGSKEKEGDRDRFRA